MRRADDTYTWRKQIPKTPRSTKNILQPSQQTHYGAPVLLASDHVWYENTHLVASYSTRDKQCMSCTEHSSAFQKLWLLHTLTRPWMVCQPLGMVIARIITFEMHAENARSISPSLVKQCLTEVRCSKEGCLILLPWKQGEKSAKRILFLHTSRRLLLLYFFTDAAPISFLW